MFLTDFGKQNYDAQERQRRMLLEEAHIAIQNTNRFQKDSNDRMMDAMRIQAMGKLTPFGNEAFTAGNAGIGYDANMRILRSFISTMPLQGNNLPQPFTKGGILTGGQIANTQRRIDFDSLVPVQDVASFSLTEQALRKNQDTFENNLLQEEYNDDAVSETELENIQQSRVKVLDILRGITAKLTAGIRRDSDNFGLSLMQDLQKVYQELLSYGYAYTRQDLEKIRVYLEEEPALIRLDVSGKGGVPMNKLAMDILNRIVKPMMSPSFVGNLAQKKALMEPIIESFYKTIQPSESGNVIPEELRIESYEEINSRFDDVVRVYQMMDDLERRQGTQQTQKTRNELKELKKQFDDKAGRLYGSLMVYSMGDIYTQSQDEITKARQDFGTLPSERKMEVLTQAIDTFDWDEQAESAQVIDSNDYPPETYSESSRPPFGQFGDIEEIEAPLVMPELPMGESESKGDDDDEPPEGEIEGLTEPITYTKISRFVERMNYPDTLPDVINNFLRTTRNAGKLRQRLREEYVRRNKDLPEVLRKGSPGRPPGRTDLAPRQPRRQAEQAIPETIKEEEVEEEPEAPIGEGRGRGRSKGASERKKIHKSGAIKPETFKKFIKMVMKKFDDSGTIRRI